MKDRELTDIEINKIAEIAANKAFDKFHQAVGKSVLKKASWIFAGVLIALTVFLQGGGIAE